MEISNYEFFAIIVFGLALFGFAAWRQIKRARDDAEATMAWREEQARHTAELLKRRQVIEAQHRLQTADLYNLACSKAPESRKPRRLSEVEKKAELRSLNLPPAANTPEHLRPDYWAPIAYAAQDSSPSPSNASSASFSGSGGSFDGGGSSGDWASSSGGSSDSGSCSSSSSDSGSSCGGSSD